MADTRILITNDDGVHSPGIHALARHVEQAGYEVIVVAPDHDASGTGAALGRISPDHPIALTETSIDGLRARVYAIGGPPALCVMAGNLEAFAPRPDIVVSGINAGSIPAGPRCTAEPSAPRWPPRTSAFARFP